MRNLFQNKRWPRKRLKMIYCRNESLMDYHSHYQTFHLQCFYFVFTEHESIFPGKKVCESKQSKNSNFYVEKWILNLLDCTFTAVKKIMKPCLINVKKFNELSPFFQRYSYVYQHTYGMLFEKCSEHYEVRPKNKLRFL